MVRQHLQRDALLRYGHHRLLVHVRVVDAHAAEDGEGLHEVLVVLRERQVVEFVYKLYDSDYLTGGVLDRHAQDRLVLEAGALVDARVEPGILLSVGDVDRLPSCGHVPRDADVDRKPALEGTGMERLILSEQECQK